MFKKIVIFGLIAVLPAILIGGAVYFWKQSVIRAIANNCISEKNRITESLAGEFKNNQNKISALNEKNKELEITKLNCGSLDEQVNSLRQTLSKYQKSLFFGLVVSKDSAIGKKFGDLILKSVGLFTDGPNLDQLGCNIKADFSGQTVVSGEYEYFGVSGGAMYDIVCFNNLDLQSELKLPRLSVEFGGGFCFSNDLAKEMFAPANSTGTATVLIDNFHLECYPAGIIGPQADLVEVLEKSK